MPDKPPIDPEQPQPEWWSRLTPEERAVFQRIMGENWRPSENAEEDTARAFDVTRRRIRYIERRALKKLHGGSNNREGRKADPLIADIERAFSDATTLRR